MYVVLVASVNLDLSMFPSFASVLFRRVDHNVWIKELGFGAGTVITVRGNEVVCRGPACSDEIIAQWGGKWFDPSTYISSVRGRLRPLVEVLLRTYSGLGLIISRYFPDRLIIAVATFLSQRTSYHTNVTKWVKVLFSGIRDYSSQYIAERLPKVGSSYQLLKLREIVSDLERTVVHSKLKGWELRRELLNIKHVGPKIADAFLLFTGEGTVFTPSDIHYSRFARRLNLLGVKEALIPNKSACLTSDAYCIKCPLNDRCLTGWSVREFSDLSGYIQTIAYVHDKIYCSLRRCGECPLRRMCVL